MEPRWQRPDLARYSSIGHSYMLRRCILTRKCCVSPLVLVVQKETGSVGRLRLFFRREAWDSACLAILGVPSLNRSRYLWATSLAGALYSYRVVVVHVALSVTLSLLDGTHRHRPYMAHHCPARVIHISTIRIWVMSPTTPKRNCR
jgi:hypothetical protein